MTTETTIAIITALILIGTYWILIWRINKLIYVIETTKGEFKKAKESLHEIASSVKGYQGVADGIIKNGVTLKLKSERFGALELDLKKQDEKEKQK